MIQKPAFVKLPMGDLVLASASAARAKLLEDAGGFSQYPVAIDEGGSSIGIAALFQYRYCDYVGKMKALAAAQQLAIEDRVPQPMFGL